MDTLHIISIPKAIQWVLAYFGTMLLYTALDILVWRKISSQYSNWLNIGTIVLFSLVYFYIVQSKTTYKLDIFENFTGTGFLLAVACVILFYLLLNKFLDPLLESIFPTSEEAYQRTITNLSKSPVTTFISVCILAPIIEEALMRGFVLGGVANAYGTIVALLLSTILFAIIHFNMVQTLSALICGLVLGFLYIKTGSILCCIVAHSGYNAINYITTIVPSTKK